MRKCLPVSQFFLLLAHAIKNRPTMKFLSKNLSLIFFQTKCKQAKRKMILKPSPNVFGISIAADNFVLRIHLNSNSCFQHIFDRRRDGQGRRWRWRPRARRRRWTRGRPQGRVTHPGGERRQTSHRGGATGERKIMQTEELCFQPFLLNHKK